MIEFLDKDGSVQLVEEIRDATHALAASMVVMCTGTIGTTWAGDAPPYTQRVDVVGVLENDNPIVDIVPDSNYELAGPQLDAWGEIYRIVPHDNYLVAFAHVPTITSIPIKVLCVRPVSE